MEIQNVCPKEKMGSATRHPAGHAEEKGAAKENQARQTDAKVLGNPGSGRVEQNQKLLQEFSKQKYLFPADAEEGGGEEQTGVLWKGGQSPSSLKDNLYPGEVTWILKNSNEPRKGTGCPSPGFLFGISPHLYAIISGH